MKIKLVWIGRSKDKNFADLIDQYRKRLSHYCALEISELKELKAGRLSAGELMKKEADLLLRQVADQDLMVLMDERGRQLSSVELSEWIQAKMNIATPRMTLVIGGAWGVDPKVNERADWIWSLSKLTLTHDMARVFLIEQIYRAFTILRGEKYHNE
ncbi:Ribosomal RNA large subunit methyltransferase H [Rosistilla carotiformis]|uniref:Ribosomal RNA large subunit methyltransferase H n=1 Tax=Rosistilla carotiformis TaxID=2528017 RepID=A0A518JVW8_9BACT|nr:23S rRNA (pseudouridine(1915)-N(3))-methyltransferase RlmH [Rosistilla carotiformis]QDV69685.1 Ribosomal RNA large subunit methyltransferase H [Rosistilla carotiformis]